MMFVDLYSTAHLGLTLHSAASGPLQTLFHVLGTLALKSSPSLRPLVLVFWIMAEVLLPQSPHCGVQSPRFRPHSPGHRCDLQVPGTPGPGLPALLMCPSPVDGGV